MSIINSKKEIFTNISALTSLKDEALSMQKNIVNGINNAKEILPFLLDLSTTLVGSDFLATILGNLFAKFVRNVEPELKNILVLQMSQYNSDQLISATAFNSGFTIPISQIDIYDKLKTDPNSDIGLSIYDNTNDNFDSKAYSAIINPGTDVSYLNISINYDESTDSLVIKPLNTTQTIEDFVTEYICGLKLINEKEFITEVLNAIYGIKTSNQNKSIDKIKAELEIDSMLDKIISDLDDINLSESDLRSIDDNAQNIKNGIAYIDLGCGYEPNQITIETLLDTLSGITSSNDPYTIGNKFNSLIDSGSPSDDENARTKKDGFIKRIINAVQKQILITTTLSPQMRTINIVLSGIKNNGDITTNNVKDDIKINSNLFKCISKKISALINEFVFNMVKKELQDLIIPAVKKIAIEKINQYTNLLKSLVGF